MGLKPANFGFLTALTSYTYVLYKTPTILQTILHFMGKIKKRQKKTPTPEFHGKN